MRLGRARSRWREAAAGGTTHPRPGRRRRPSSTWPGVLTARAFHTARPARPRPGRPAARPCMPKLRVFINGLKDGGGGAAADAAAGLLSAIGPSQQLAEPQAGRRRSDPSSL